MKSKYLDKCQCGEQKDKTYTLCVYCIGKKVEIFIQQFKRFLKENKTKYILKNKKAIPCNDVIKWAKQFEKSDRRVAKDTVGDAYISTVFSGLDHSFNNDIPLLFETMVFGGKLDQEIDRYSTWKEAEIGHKKMIDKVKLINS